MISENSLKLEIVYPRIYAKISEDQMRNEQNSKNVLKKYTQNSWGSHLLFQIYYLIYMKCTAFVLYNSAFDLLIFDFLLFLRLCNFCNRIVLTCGRCHQWLTRSQQPQGTLSPAQSQSPGVQ